MEFLSGKAIKTGLNSKEVRIGRHGLLVDGFCDETKTVYQFHGCYWHGHGCNASSSQMIGNKDAPSRLADTKTKEDYIRHLGYSFVSIWECEWQKMVSDNSTLKTFLKAFFDTAFGINKSYTQSELLQLIEDDRLFGFVECDIHVPDHLTDKFSEMSPIFKNVSLSREDLSPHMKDFAEQNGLLKQPQRCLVGSMKAVKQLFLSTLLRWYIAHGLVVSKIYQVIQFQRSPVFRKFGETVTNARRDGDVNEDFKLLANNAKLVGNSMYGKTIINKTTHRDTGYTTNERKASQIIRSRRFHSLNIIDDDLFETTCYKKSVIQILSILTFNALR